MKFLTRQKLRSHETWRVLCLETPCQVCRSQNGDSLESDASFAMLKTSRNPNDAVTSMDVWHALGRIRKEAFEYVAGSVEGVVLGIHDS
jgi:hypothetical protein